MDRTLRQLRSMMQGDVYVFLRNTQTGERFLQDAEREGFTIGGDRPTARPFASVMALHDDTITCVGTNGMIRFGCGDTADFHRVDYELYASGAADFGYGKTGDPSASVLVRPFAESDFDAYLALTMDALGIQPEQDGSDSLIRNAAYRQYAESDEEHFSVIRASDRVYCGDVSMKDTAEGCELGIVLFRQYQNRGMGTAALRQFCDYCYRERGIRRLLVRIAPDNARSIHVFEKLGAVYLTKKAPPLLLRTYEILGKTIPEDLDETAGVLHYELRLPLSV